MERAEHRNLLLNLTNKDPIYKVIERIILSLLPNEISKKVSKSEDLKMLATDIFFIHYSTKPILIDNHQNSFLENARKAVSKYMNTVEFAKARSITELDEETSLIFAATFLKSLLEELSSQGKGKEKQSEELVEDETKNGESKDNTNESKTNNQNESFDQSADDNENDKKFTNSKEKDNFNVKDFEEKVSEAISQATAYATAAKQLKSSGLSSGSSREKGDIKKLLRLAEVVISVKESREVLELFRKLEDLSPRTVHIDKKQSVYGEEVGGYSRTKNFERAAPREFALAEELLLSKYTSEGLLTLEKEVGSKGIVYILLDKSGSMIGNKLVWSRSVALFLLRLGKLNGMELLMRMFDSEPHPYDKPLRSFSDMVELVLTVSPNGGTDIKNALNVAIEDLRKIRGKRNSFVFLITDGEDRFTFQKNAGWKGISLFSIMVEGDNEVLKAISDLYLKTGLTLEGALAIGREGSKLLYSAKKAKYRHA
ncbi:MAG: hypothetical protein JHC28_00900 [Thermoprotei archaeon]|jgi:uncharacterized protein with von Willebrand factor type A (vWA) domain|nr:hypothetical protein [Thermoprotei archaeon]